MNKIVNSSDKHNLQIVLLLSAFVLLCISVFVGTRYVPLKWIAVITIAAEVLFLMPVICKMYCEMYETDIGVLKYVPIANFVQIFSPLIAKVTVIALVLVALCFGAMCIPATFIGSILGENIALIWTGKCFVFLVLAAVFLDVCIGAGYCSVIQGISARLYDLFDMKLGGTTWLYRIVLFVPLIRTVGLVFIYSQLTSLKMHDYGNKVAYNDEYYEEEE